MYIPIKSYYKLKGVIKMQQSYLNYPPQLSSFVPSQIYLANNYQPMLQKNGTIPYYPMPNGSMMSYRFENPEHIQRGGRPQSLQYSRNAYNSPKYYNTLQNSELIVNSDKWNLYQSNVIANPSNFPFGKDRIKLSNYVTEKLQWQNDQENKRVLQKFRIDAIKNRNQRVMKHLGKMPYITQSMLPGSNIDASKYMETPEKAPIYQKKVNPAPLMPVTYFADPRFAYIQTKRVQTVGVQANIPQKGQQMIKIPRKVGQTTSVGISVNFQQQFPLKPYKTPKKNKKKRGYTIQQQQQVKSMNKISSMIHEINKKLKKNGEMLQESLLQNVSLAQSRAISQKQSPIKKFSYSRRNFFPQSSKIKKDVQPSVVYHNKNKRSKTEASEYNQQKQPKREINQHLQLLKLNKKRIEDLDEYVYKL